MVGMQAWKNRKEAGVWQAGRGMYMRRVCVVWWW